MKISVIIPLYNPKKKNLSRIQSYLKRQTGLEIIEVDGKNGLANAYNTGIKKSKGEIIITLHQDCIPTRKDDIYRLVKPFQDDSVVLSYGMVKEPKRGGANPTIPSYRMENSQLIGRVH